MATGDARWIVVFAGDNYETWMEADGAEVWLVSKRGFERLQDGYHPRYLTEGDVVRRYPIQPPADQR